MQASAHALFAAMNLAAMAGWACLATAPWWRRRAIPAARLMVALVAGLYVALVAAGLSRGGGAGVDFATLEGVRALLANPQAANALWAHFLALDLFAGAWIAEDAPRVGVPHWAVLPLLALTLMAGPAGVLAYFLVKAWRGRAGG